tara:strand:+ start:1727 stop:2155 length:429 start_codon:yes stop_codon:yes gene_type:complete
MSYFFGKSNTLYKLPDNDEKLDEKFFYKECRNTWFKEQIAELILVGPENYCINQGNNDMIEDSYMEIRYNKEYNKYIKDQKQIRKIYSDYDTTNDWYMDCDYPKATLKCGKCFKELYLNKNINIQTISINNEDDSKTEERFE